MSQSDYIKYKKVSVDLKTNKLPSILNQQDYISFKEYSLENNIPVTKLNYNKLIPVNRQIVMNMEKKTSNVSLCPTFIICKNTNNRTNRIPLLDTQIQPQPYRPLNERETAKDIKDTRLCLCINT